MRFTTQRKIITVITILLFFSQGVNTTISLLQFQENYKQILIEKVAVVGKELKDTVEDALNSEISIEELPKANERCQSIVDRYEEIDYCYVADPKMKVLHHNDPSYIGKILLVPPLEEILEPEGAAIYFSSFENRKFYEVTLSVFSQEEQVGDVRLGIPVQIINDKARSLLPNSILVMLVSFGLSVLLSIFLARTIANPIKKLTEITKEISLGKLDIKIDPQLTASKDEIGDLALSFNDMSRKLRESYSSLEEKIKELKKVDELKSTILRDVSHELKTPVSLTTVAANLLGDEIERAKLNKQKVKKYLEIVLKNSERSRIAIGSILEISKLATIGSIKMSDIKVDSIINTVVEQYTIPAEKKGLKIRSEMQKVPKVQLNQELITRLLANLIENAIRFTEKGHVDIICKKDGNYLAISVKDTGKGIAKKDMDKLFKPFSKLDPSSEGVGIGLAICKKIAELHNGKIEVKSTPGKGSEFTVRIPIKQRGS